VKQLTEQASMDLLSDSNFSTSCNI